MQPSGPSVGRERQLFTGGPAEIHSSEVRWMCKSDSVTSLYLHVFSKSFLQTSSFQASLLLRLQVSVLRKTGSRQRRTLAKMSKHDYHIDMAIVPEDAPGSYKAGTVTDQHDMRRVGRTQELRVSMIKVPSNICFPC